MSTLPDERRVIDDMLDDIELELASIRLMTERERLDRPHAKRSAHAATTPSPKVIDTRGIDINKTAADSLPRPAPPRSPQQDRQEQARASLAARLAMLRADAAE
jgi:hypothetical protein